MKNRIKIKFTAITLVISMLLSGSLMPVWAADGLTKESTATESKVQESIIPEEDMALEQVDLLSKEDSALWNYIDLDSIHAEKHTARLEALEEPDTFVFQNSDGTRTTYFMEEDVKYVDSKGSTVIKDITLAKKETGFGITRNNVDLLIPNNLKSGVDIGYADYSIKLIPQNTATNILPEQKNNAVRYNGVFGAKTTLVYTPTLSGIKEDIILSEYIENASYTFILETDGLTLQNRDGKYVLCNGLQRDPVFYLGEILVYDSIGKPDMGAMTVETIEAGQKYLLTVTASDEFLSDPDTVYPVTIDPSISISDSETSGDIEDAVIFENRPTTNFGTYVYNRVGTPSSSYGVGRTVVRLRGLLDSAEWASVHPDNIQSLYFYATEATGSGSQTISACPITLNTTWTESNVRWKDIDINYEPGLSTTATMRYNEEAAFNLTTIAIAWKYGYYNPEAGFIMMNSNETLDKSFCSSEYSNSSMRPRVVMTYTALIEGGDSFATAGSLFPNCSASVNITTGHQKKYFKFTPEITGFYTIQSLENNGDPYVMVYNNAEQLICTDNDGGDDSNFALSYHFVFGVTYYFALCCYSTGVGSYTFTFSYSTYDSPINASAIAFGESYIVNNGAPYQATFFKFTPLCIGEYLFYSTSTGSNPKVWLYDSNFIMLAQDDNSAGNGDFKISIDLVGRQKYYIVVGHSSSNSGECALKTNRVLSYVNYYDSSFAANPTLISYISAANEFSNFVFYNYFGIKISMDGVATQRTTILDSCTTGLNEPCSNEVCGTQCENGHHKNVGTISNELFNASREDDHLYVLWTNREIGVTYCTEGHNPFGRAIACVINYRPVIHFLSISGDDTNKKLACMTLNLVHETAHTLRMYEAYNIDGHDVDGATVCVMEEFDSNNAYEFYLAVLTEGVDPFCDSCKAEMDDLTKETSIIGNQQ